MSVVALTVTEFSRGLSDFLNEVQTPGQSLDIQRGKGVLPAVACAGFPIDQLDELLARGPQLTVTERQAMAADIRTLRSPC